MISAFSSSGKDWWQVELLVFSAKTVLEVITIDHLMEIQVSNPQSRDQEPIKISSKSFWTILQVNSSCLILTPCFDSSFLSAQGFCLSFNHVRLWNNAVASIPLSGDVFQCGAKGLEPLPSAAAWSQSHCFTLVALCTAWSCDILL